MAKPTIEKIKKVKCPIFQSRNEDMTKIIKVINEAKTVERKTYFAERLIREAEELLSCEHFDKEKAECKICHYITKLRKRTANLIVKAKDLKTNK